jgi:hypothetical protein
MPVRMTEQAAAPPRQRPQQLSLLVLGAAVVVAGLVVGWLAFAGGSSSTPSYAHPTLVSQAQLERFAVTLDHPVYWAGPKPGYSYELTSSHDRVWVRYLPSGVKAGDPRASFFVVGTYELSDAFAGLRRVAKNPSSVSRSIADGGLLVYDGQRPTSVYFSYPGVKYQVEVYAPSPPGARSLILRGKIAPIR